MKVGLAQIAPIWLDKSGTLAKVKDYISRAGKQECKLVVFGEALIPGYPFWLEYTGGAKFNDKVQKEIYAHYNQQAVSIPEDLAPICQQARKEQTAIYLGCIERVATRGNSLYCAMVYIDKEGEIRSVHHKLVPTYDERLVWSPGDGNGLRVHQLEEFKVGGLNCWENWMPMARTALYGQGEELHVAIWPGSVRNTHDITSFMAKEARSFVVSVGALNRRSDIPTDIPHADLIINSVPEQITDGGSCIAGPDGEWILEPQAFEEKLFTATLERGHMLEERQNFSPAGHYSRPDVFELRVHRERQGTVKL